VIENVALAALLITVMYTDWRFPPCPNALTYPRCLSGSSSERIEGIPGELFTPRPSTTSRLILAFASPTRSTPGAASRPATASC